MSREYEHLAEHHIRWVPPMCWRDVDRSSVGCKVLLMAYLYATHAWLGHCQVDLPRRNVSRCNIASRLSWVENIQSIGFGAETMFAFADFTSCTEHPIVLQLLLILCKQL